MRRFLGRTSSDITVPRGTSHSDRHVPSEKVMNTEASSESIKADSQVVVLKRRFTSSQVECNGTMPRHPWPWHVPIKQKKNKTIPIFKDTFILETQRCHFVAVAETQFQIQGYRQPPCRCCNLTGRLLRGKAACRSRSQNSSVPPGK